MRNDKFISYFALEKHFHKDFKDTPNQYADLAEGMKVKLNSNGRSVQDQMMETMILIEKMKNSEFLSEISISLSSSTIVLTIILSTTYLWLAIILGFWVLALSILFLLRNKERKERLCYYIFKLECLKELSKEQLSQGINAGEQSTESEG